MRWKQWLIGAAVIPLIGQASCSASPSTTPQITPAKAVSPYIGVKYPPPPAGWQDGRAALTATAGNVDYSVQEFVQGQQQMLWFMTATGQDAQGHRTWVVTDVLVRSNIKEPGAFSWGSCTLNDQLDEEIVAFGNIQAARLENATRAWRANHSTGHFEPIATTGIVCEAETIGP